MMTETEMRALTVGLNDIRKILRDAIDNAEIPKNWECAPPLIMLSSACRDMADTCRLGERWALDAGTRALRNFPRDEGRDDA